VARAAPSPDTLPDAHRLRRDFPVLERVVHGKPLVYLDNAATTHKPRAVVEAVDDFYLEHNSNVHRGVHALSQEATELFEAAREKTRAFLGASSTKEVLFTRGATESVNLVANAWGLANLGPGDEVLVSEMEHHSNIVPWQMVCEKTGATLRVIPMDDRGQLEMGALDEVLTERTRLVGIVHVSNALGTTNPVETIIARAHAVGALVLVDGAQAVPHVPVDVRALDADFYVFSGHKVYGPTGIGVLYGKQALLEAMPPWQGGGDMIRMVTFEKTTYADLPAKFEAGTPNVAGAIGLGAALDYVESVGRPWIAAHEADLLAYGTRLLSDVPEIRLIGTAEHKAAVLSFLFEGVHPHDVGTILDLEGVAVRTGHHCAFPVMQHFGVPATTRASLALYNTREDLDALVAALVRVREVFGG
jgi:cysteine desulfurase/selenocysteine lyase